MANKKEVRGTRESNNRSQERGTSNRSSGNNRSNSGQSRQASEWREMDRPQSGGRERSLDTRHAGGGRDMEDESHDMSRFYAESSNRGGRDSGERGRTGRGTQRRNSGRNFPMDNLTYDVVTILHEKSKGLEAFDRYLQDARGDEVEDLLNEIREQDERAVEELQDHLHRLLMEGGRGRRAA